MDSLAFYVVAVPAVLLFGIGKGGFGGGLGIVSVPMMALVVSPAVAAAVLLPLLILMDLIGLRAYWRGWSARIVTVMLPASMVGIALGALAFGYLSDDLVRLLIGLIAIAFTLNYFLRPAAALGAARHRPALGAFWGAVAGFTSTLAHAGGAPANFYVLPLKLDKTVFVSTMVVLFATINAIKLIPYGLLGLLRTDTLTTSLLLAPVAASGMLLGIWLHKRVNETLFYRLCYGFVLLTGLKLVWDGAT